MKCDFDYCIYNEDFVCLLNKIEINSSGQCKDCIIVEFPAEKLVQYKRTQLQEMTKRYGNFEK